MEGPDFAPLSPARARLRSRVIDVEKSANTAFRRFVSRSSSSSVCQGEVLLYRPLHRPPPPCVHTSATLFFSLPPHLHLEMRKEGLMRRTRHSSFHLPRPNISKHISDTKGSAWVPSLSLILIPTLSPLPLPPILSLPSSPSLTLPPPSPFLI